jgi:hypothetical protein
MSAADDLWGSFSHDPRVSANAGLRATDRDRDLVHQVLAEAYADGRLDRSELDARTEHTAAARTLGELPPLVSDLVVATPVPARSVVPVGGPELRERAVAKYRADRRDALVGFLVPSLICTFIWLVLGAHAFFWPGFVIVGTGINVLSMLIRRENIIEDNVRRLEKKLAKDRAREQAGELESGRAEHERPDQDRDPDRRPDQDENEKPET